MRMPDTARMMAVLSFFLEKNEMIKRTAAAIKAFPIPLVFCFSQLSAILRYC